MSAGWERAALWGGGVAGVADGWGAGGPAAAGASLGPGIVEDRKESVFAEG